MSEGHRRRDQVGDEMAMFIWKGHQINQVTGHKVKFALPRIIVIGDQSSGKSSTLESALVRRDFLPRGTGIVTRCPLVITLINRPDQPEEIEFSADSGAERRVICGERAWREVQEEIRRRTIHRAKDNRGISAEHIKMTLSAPDVPDLELVDLPGFTQNPVGDQPNTISEEIRSLVRSYISHDNTLILAVTAATVDVETSEAIKMAREADPMGTRTLGVITKPDCSEKEAEMKKLIEVLENKVLFLKKGYVAIKNRTQNQADNQMTVDESLRDEENFFQNNPNFDTIREKTGSRYLLRVLCKELGQKIKEKLPEINSELGRQLADLDKELHRLGYNQHAVVSDDQQQHVNKLAKTHLELYPALMDNAIDIFVKKVEETISLFIKAEGNFINTRHPNLAKYNTYSHGRGNLEDIHWEDNGGRCTLFGANDFAADSFSQYQQYRVCQVIDRTRDGDTDMETIQNPRHKKIFAFAYFMHIILAQAKGRTLKSLKDQLTKETSLLPYTALNGKNKGANGIMQSIKHTSGKFKKRRQGRKGLRWRKDFKSLLREFSYPHGKILCVVLTQQEEPTFPRANQDVLQIKQMCKKLNMDFCDMDIVRAHEEIKAIFDTRKYTMLVKFVIAKGGTDMINGDYIKNGVNEKISIRNEFISNYTTKKFPSLSGCPDITIVQMITEEHKSISDVSVQRYSSSVVSQMPVDKALWIASVPGNVGYATEDGSPFIHEICKILADYPNLTFSHLVSATTFAMSKKTYEFEGVTGAVIPNLFNTLRAPVTFDNNKDTIGN